MLKVNNLNVHYGVINAVKNVTFDVNEGEIVALIGANGAGKTSIMHALSGLLKSTTGDIFFMDKNINKMPAHKIIAEGLAQVPEGRRIFAQLSVEDNLEMGAYLRTDKIGIERDLMSRPKLLLLDEPSMGLSPILVNEIFEIIKEINKDGVTIFLVEQNANKALSIANRAYVLETGKITISGEASDVANNPKVREAYLG